MILREATAGDLAPLVALATIAWDTLGITHGASVTRFQRLLDQDFRIAVMYDGRQLVAGLGAHWLDTDRGPGYEVTLLAVDPDSTAKVDLIDAICLYGLNLAAADGRDIIVSRRRKTTSGLHWGRDLAGMETREEPTDIRQIGDVRTIMEHILMRHPEWRI